MYHTAPALTAPHWVDERFDESDANAMDEVAVVAIEIAVAANVPAKVSHEGGAAVAFEGEAVEIVVD